MDIDLQRKLIDLDKGQVEILRRLDDVAGTLQNTIVEIGGVPDDIGRDPKRRSMRGRIHDLENDRAAQDIAKQAVASMKSISDAASQKRFNRGEKLAALILAALVAVGPYIAPYLHH